MVDVIHILRYALYAGLSMASLALLKSAWPHYQAGSIRRALIRLTLGVLIFAFAMFVLVLILSRDQLSTAVPIALGFNMLFAAVISRAVFGERIGYTKVLGNIFIFAGAALLAGAIS